MSCCRARLAPDVMETVECVMRLYAELFGERIDGEWVLDHDCPIHVSPHGEVRWLGVAWIGVPMPLRWCAWVVKAASGRLPGCGCVAVLKKYVGDQWL